MARWKLPKPRSMCLTKKKNNNKGKKKEEARAVSISGPSDAES